MSEEEVEQLIHGQEDSQVIMEHSAEQGTLDKNFYHFRETSTMKTLSRWFSPSKQVPNDIEQHLIIVSRISVLDS